MNLVCFNGNFFSEREKLFSAQNRNFKYGDGLFETIKVYKGRILFGDFHFDRLFQGLKMLQIDHELRTEDLSKNLLELCSKNNCSQLARARLTVYRSESNQSEYVMEAVFLSKEKNEWNESGLKVGIYPYFRKTTDAFSNLKTANFLPYVMAERYAEEKGWNEAIVMNTDNFLAETSKANIFLVKENEIHTPALHQGCINGVVRRFLTDELKKRGYPIHQEEISEQELLEADEVFLTNSIYDIRWVKTYKNKNYSCTQTFSIYQQLIASMYD